MKDIVALLQLPAYILGALAIASAILLFAPPKVIEMLYMTEFRDKYGFAIAIVFIVSVSILSVLLLKLLYSSYCQKRNSKQLKKNQTKYLSTLEGRKVDLINSFLRQPTKTLMLPVNDGMTNELQYFRVITPAGNAHLVDMMNPEIPFFLQPWVSERIKESKELQEKYWH